MSVFHEARDVPTNSCILLSSREEALSYPRGDIRLGFCSDCGFISNTAFDPKLTEYSGRYEETQACSPTFNRFHSELAKDLIRRYDLEGKDILEIGCGKGEFLTLMAELGGNRCTGFDPGCDESRVHAPARGSVRFVKDFYSEKYTGWKADFVCCKMTLEHIPATRDFVQNVRSAIADRLETVVYFQVPDVTRILQACAFEDIYYEHCSYFSPSSLQGLFESCGFAVARTYREYGAQYLGIEARPAPYPSISEADESNDRKELRTLVKDFPARFERATRRWADAFERVRSLRRKAVLWGSGSKAVSFLTTLGLGDEVDCVVDINPRRHGHHMPGTGHEIIGPDSLSDVRPDLVVIMNAVYEEEIRDQLSDMGLKPDLATL